jgi:hypothetical protein
LIYDNLFMCSAVSPLLGTPGSKLWAAKGARCKSNAPNELRLSARELPLRGMI